MKAKITIKKVKYHLMQIQTGSSSDINLRVIGNDNLAQQIANDNGITFINDAGGNKFANV
ncbi:hypothetical protein GSQ49_21735, partial [Clostridioides difficile]|nr:hypothetical protein [Clostridioides difficile]